MRRQKIARRNEEEDGYIGRYTTILSEEEVLIEMILFKLNYSKELRTKSYQ